MSQLCCHRSPAQMRPVHISHILLSSLLAWLSRLFLPRFGTGLGLLCEGERVPVQISMRRFTLKGLLTSQLAKFLRLRFCERFTRAISIHVSLRATNAIEIALLSVLPSRFRFHEIRWHFL